MTVKELIDRLKSIDSDMPIILSTDPEGNYFRELNAIEPYNNSYKDNSIGISELTPELEKEGYTEEDILDGVKCVVLWP